MTSLASTHTPHTRGHFPWSHMLIYVYGWYPSWEEDWFTKGKSEYLSPKEKGLSCKVTCVASTENLFHAETPFPTYPSSLTVFHIRSRERSTLSQAAISTLSPAPPSPMQSADGNGRPQVSFPGRIQKFRWGGRGEAIGRLGQHPAFRPLSPPLPTPRNLQTSPLRANESPERNPLYPFCPQPHQRKELAHPIFPKHPLCTRHPAGHQYWF